MWTSLTRQFAQLDPEGAFQRSLIQRYLTGVARGDVEVERVAGAGWLAAVGPAFLGPALGDAVSGLASVAVVSREVDKSWAEGREAVLVALAKLSRALREEAEAPAPSDVHRRAARALLAGCDDYTIDTRGDIGKVVPSRDPLIAKFGTRNLKLQIVRESSMKCLQGFFTPLEDGRSVSASTGLAAGELTALLQEAMGKIIQQACEKIDLTRKVDRLVFDSGSKSKKRSLPGCGGLRLWPAPRGGWSTFVRATRGSTTALRLFRRPRKRVPLPLPGSLAHFIAPIPGSPPKSAGCPPRSAFLASPASSPPRPTGSPFSISSPPSSS